MDNDLIFALPINLKYLETPEQMAYFMRRLKSLMEKCFEDPSFEASLNNIRGLANAARTPELKELALMHLRDAADRLFPGGYDALQM